MEVEFFLPENGYIHDILWSNYAGQRVMALKLFLTIFLLNISSLASGLFAQYLLSIDSLKREHSFAKTDTSKVKIAFEIGREQWFQRNFRDAAYYLNESITTAEKIQ